MNEFPATVIIPCHNAQPWLASTLATVSAQTHQPVEVILIADRCSDDSVKVAREFPMEITIYETDYGNAATARNHGIERATGEWIALLDADDHWYPEHLATAASLLAGSDHVAFCARYDLMDNDNNKRPLSDYYMPQLQMPMTQMDHNSYIQLMVDHMPFGHLTVLFKRGRVLEIGGYDPTFVRRHDIHLWLRVIYNHTWAYHPDLAGSYRDQTPGAISRNRVEVSYYEMLAMVSNQQQYQHPLLGQLIGDYARLAMSTALHQADRQWAKRLRDLAWPHLSTRYRYVYGMLGLCPGLLRLLVWCKRQTIGRVQNHRRTQRQKHASQEWAKQQEMP